MTIYEWKESMREEVEGTVFISYIGNVPHHENTSKYIVYNEENTFDRTFDITTDEYGEIENIQEY